MQVHLYRDFFSIRAVLHSVRLVKSVDEEPRIQRADLGLDHHWILVSMAGPGINAPGY